LRRVTFFLFLFSFIILFSNHSYTQEFYKKKYPSYGGGITFGYNYYFPNDLNDYIDASGFSSTNTKEHIHTGINVGLFLAFAPNKFIEITPEFGYLYSRSSLSSMAMDVVVSHVRLGTTIFYIKSIREGFNLRLGAGLSNYWGTVSWESDFSSPQTWKGSSLGFHTATGVEMLLNPNMSVSILALGRFIDIGELKHSQGYIVKTRNVDAKNLHLSFSGIQLKLVLHYYL
jgi:hypothetical protein